MKRIKIWNKNKSACLLPGQNILVSTWDNLGIYRILKLMPAFPGSHVCGWKDESKELVFGLNDIAYFSYKIDQKQKGVKC